MIENAIHSTDLRAILNSINEGKTVIPLQKERNGRPIFAIDGLLLYRKLAYYLGHDYSLFCFTPSPLKEIDKIASYYISEMKQVQRRGPYALIGFCSFNFIAIEMAMQLYAQGENVDILSLIEFKGGIDCNIENHSTLYTNISNPYPGKTILFQAKTFKEYDKFKINNPNNHTRFLIDQTKYYEVEGDHFGIFQEPGVNMIAESIIKELENPSFTWKTSTTS
jgi:thioesterase domain-containing protein